VKYPQMRQSYERNRKLIDFNQIPQNLQNKILYQATPFFMGTTANALGWGWNGPNPTDLPPPPPPPPPRQYIRRPILHHRGTSRLHYTKKPTPLGVLNRSGSITWANNS